MRFGSALGFERRRRGGVTGGGAVLPSSFDAAMHPPTMTLASIATYPPELDFVLDETVSVNDNLRIQASALRDFSVPLFADIVVPLTAGNVAGTNPVNIQSVLGSISSPAKTYFRSRNERPSNSHYSDWTPLILHGDTAAPVITSSATASFPEWAPVAYALSADKYVTWTLIGADAGLLEISGSNARLAGNASPDFTVKSVYDFTLRATGDNGLSTDLPVEWTITSRDRTPDAYSWTTINNAVPSSAQASSIAQFTGLEPGFDIPCSFSGVGFTMQLSPDGVTWGAAFSPGNFTVRNGWYGKLNGTAPSANNQSKQVSTTIGTSTQTWTINTPSSLVLGAGASSGYFPGSPYTFAGQTLSAGFLNLFVFHGYGRVVTSVVCKKTGQADVPLTRIVLSPDVDRSVWAGSIPVGASDWSVVITDASDTPVQWCILPATVTTSNTTPSQTDNEQIASGSDSPFAGATNFSIPVGGCAYSFIESIGNSTTYPTATRSDGAVRKATFNFTDFDGNKRSIFVDQHQANGAIAFAYTPTPSSGASVIGLAYNA